MTADELNSKVMAANSLVFSCKLTADDMRNACWALSAIENIADPEMLYAFGNRASVLADEYRATVAKITHKRVRKALRDLIDDALAFAAA